MNTEEKDYNLVLSELLNYRSYDVPWNHVLNSICSKPLDIAITAFQLAIDTNLGDPRIFKGTYKLEKEVIAWLSQLLHGENCTGNIVSGGTEANFLALYNAKKASYTYTPEIIISETAHYSIEKVLKILNITPKIIPVDDKFKMDTSKIEDFITPNTIAIVATAGTSEFGSIDPIPEIAKIACKHKLYFHVDAATGGFIIPFAKNIGFILPDFDFSVHGVSSITIDPHKYGLTPISSGAIIFKDNFLSNKMENESFFISTPAHRTFVGTRSGAPICSVYAVLNHLGISGFNAITKDNFQKTAYLVERLQSNSFKLLLEPELNIICVYVSNSKWLLQEMETYGWILSASRRIKNVLRIVIQHHTTYEDIDAFVILLKRLESSYR